MNIDYTLYLVTNNKNKSESEFLNIIKQASKGGISLIQVREKKLETNDFIEIASKVKNVVRPYNIPVIINDNVEVAKEINADGVHVGQDDLDARKVKETIGHDKILGVSAHNIKEAKKAEKDGADYIGCGTLFGSPTKSDAHILTKKELIEIVESVNIPVVYIGGVTEENINELENTGIKGVSVVSAIMESENPEYTSQNLRKKIENII